MPIIGDAIGHSCTIGPCLHPLRLEFHDGERLRAEVLVWNRARSRSLPSPVTENYGLHAPEKLDVPHLEAIPGGSRVEVALRNLQHACPLTKRKLRRVGQCWIIGNCSHR